MKTSNKILLGVLSLIVLFTLSMFVFVRSNLTSQDIQQDNSEWQTQIRNVDAFHKISDHTAANIFISQGETKFEMKGTFGTNRGATPVIRNGTIPSQAIPSNVSNSREDGIK